MIRRGRELPWAFRALSHVSYRRYFLGSLVVQLGFWFSHIAFQALMVDLTDNDELRVTLLFTVLFIPVILVAPLAGTVADRFDRKRVLVSCYLGIGAVALLQTMLVATGRATPNSVLVVGFAMGSLVAFLGPAMQAVAANLVPPRDLPSAISLQAVVGNLTRVVGPLVAAPLIDRGWFEASWAAYGAACLTAVGIASTLQLLPYERDTTSSGVLRRFVDGIRHARDRQPAFATLTTVAVLSVFGVSHIALLPSFTEDALGQPAERFAWIVAVTGAGALLGALWVANRRNDPTLQRGSVLAVFYSTALLGFSLSSDFALALVLQFVVGFFYFASFTTLQTLVQQLVDDAKRGRVMSLFQICWAGLVPVGSLILGLLASDNTLGLGARGALVTTCSACVVWSVGVSLWRASARRREALLEIPDDVVYRFDPH